MSSHKNASSRRSRATSGKSNHARPSRPPPRVSHRPCSANVPLSLRRTTEAPTKSSYTRAVEEDGKCWVQIRGLPWQATAEQITTFFEVGPNNPPGTLVRTPHTPGTVTP